MAHAPRKKRKRVFLKDIKSRSDHEIMERIFGKRVVKQLDAVVQKNSKMKEDDEAFSFTSKE